MPRLLRTLLSGLRAFVSPSDGGRVRSRTATQDTPEAAIQRMVVAIDRSLCLARAAGSETSRNSHTGIARLNFTALRVLTAEFSSGVTPEVRRLAHAFTQPDPWNFAAPRTDDTRH